MRPASVRILLPLLAFALLRPAAAMAQESSSAYGPLPVFELHSGFWINLHHALYLRSQAARDSHPVRQQRGNPDPQSKLKTMKDSAPALTPAETTAWNNAVAYYAANYANKDLLFNTDLMLLKNQLEDFEDCDDLSGARKKTCDAGLPGNVTPMLDAAAPVYRAHLWPDQDRANRRWIARVAPLVEEQGVGISQRLADVYQTKWPKQKIRVDVTGYANWAGAYTTLDPLRVTISSTDSRNQGDEAFEVLFHEASHGIAEPVQDAIVRECRQRVKGHSARPLARAHFLHHRRSDQTLVNLNSWRIADRTQGTGKTNPIGPPAPARETYTPYAIREGLYQRGWNDYYQLLIRFWQPYLDNKSTFDDAIARMVSAL